MGLGLSAGLSSSTGHEGNSAKLGRQKAQEGWSDLPGRPPKCRLVSHPGSQSHWLPAGQMGFKPLFGTLKSSRDKRVD